MPPRDPELQERTCRACNRRYDYPVPRSTATRFYCDTCAGLAEPVRNTLERMNKRIKDLERRVAAGGGAIRAGGSGSRNGGGQPDA